MVISAKHAGKAKAKLVRDTEECAPKPIDLSRAADCDFIGAQDTSLCLLPFPDDYYTVKDSSTRDRPAGRPPRRGHAAERGRDADRRPRRTTSTTASAPAR